MFLTSWVGPLGYLRVVDAAHLGGDLLRQLLHLLGDAEDLELDHGEFTKHVSVLEVAELLH